MRKLKSAVDEALLVKHFDIFSSRLRGLHTLVQNMVGCDMQSIEKAAYDPVFYLHNTFIDYLWAYWQELQRWRGKTEGNKGRDYKCNLCYEYEDLIFDGMTPAQFLKDMSDAASDKGYGKGYDTDKGYGNGLGKGRGKGKGYGYGKVNRYGHKE